MLAHQDVQGAPQVVLTHAKVSAQVAKGHVSYHVRIPVNSIVQGSVKVTVRPAASLLAPNSVKTIAQMVANSPVPDNAKATAQVVASLHVLRVALVIVLETVK